MSTPLAREQAGASGTADNLRVEFVTDVSALPPLAPAWERLNGRQRDHDATFFQSYAWTYAIARIRARRSPRSFRLLVATVWRGGELIGLWPLSLRRRYGTWLACELGEPFGQFAGVVFQEAEDIAAGVTAIVAALTTCAAALKVEAVIVGSPLHAALTKCGARVIDTNEAVVVDLRGYTSVGEFRQSVNSKTRKNLRNLYNRLQRAHAVQHVVVDSPAQVPAMIVETFDARVRWLQRHGRTSPAFRDADFRTLVTELPSHEGIQLIGFSLATEKARLSAQWGFVYAGRSYAYISAMDPAYDEFSPGRVHLGMVIEACLDRGIEVVELMPPPSPYKLAWSDRTRALETLAMPFGLRGRLALQMSAGLTGPTVRRLSRAIPEPLRKRLVGRLNRL